MKNFKLLSIATIASISLLLSCSSDKPKESTSTTTEEPKSMIDEAPSSSGLETKIEAGKANYEKHVSLAIKQMGKVFQLHFLHYLHPII